MKKINKNRGTVEKSKISGVGSNGGTILSELIKNNVLEDVSSTEVRLKGELGQHEKMVRKIAGDDFDKIWGILQQSHRVLSFPELKIDKEKLWLEFAPKIYLEKKIGQLETELKDLWADRSAPKYSTNVKIAMTQGILKNYQKSLENILEDEKQRYKRMYEETIERTEKRAKKGDNAAIFRLIKCDKKWLFKDWVKSKILIAEALDDREFLDEISEALKNVKKRSPQYQLVLYLRQLKSQGFNFANPEGVEDLRDFLLKRFQDMEVPESNPIFKPLLDGDYFNKFLKRHRIRKK